MRKRLRAEPAGGLAGLQGDPDLAEETERYSRRRRKPAQAWWIASAEKEALITESLPPLDDTPTKKTLSKLPPQPPPVNQVAAILKKKVKSVPKKKLFSAPQVKVTVKPKPVTKPKAAPKVDENSGLRETVVQKKKPSGRNRRRIQAMLDSETESSGDEDGWSSYSYSDTEGVSDNEGEPGGLDMEPETPSPKDGKRDALASEGSGESGREAGGAAEGPAVAPGAAQGPDWGEMRRLEDESSILYCGRVFRSCDGSREFKLVRYDSATRTWTVRQEGVEETLSWFDLLSLVCAEESSGMDETLQQHRGALGSPVKVTKASSFVNEMCDLWSSGVEAQASRRLTGAEDGAEDADAPTAVVTPPCPGDLAPGGPFHSPIQQQQTSSDKRFVDNLLLTPGSEEVTPESKPHQQQEAAQAVGGSGSGLNHRTLSSPPQILTGSPRSRRAMQAGERAGGSPATARKARGLGGDPRDSAGGGGSGARKKLMLTCDKGSLENELCNLLINKKIIKHYRDGHGWACRDVSGKAIDQYRIAELEERLVSTAREARHVFTSGEIDQISRRAHAEWRLLKERQQLDQGQSPQRPLKGILKQGGGTGASVGAADGVARPTPSASKRVTFLAELVEFGSPMKLMH